MEIHALEPKIIVALDLDEESRLKALIATMDPKTCRLKIGKTLFTRFGPAWVKQLQDQGFEIFLDLKFHDIPQQVAGACLQAAQLGVWMVNVHALGGMSMLQAAKAAVAQPEGKKRPWLIGVTILTSMQETDLQQLGIQGTMPEVVMRLARLCYEAGLDGVVCSPHEVAMLKKAFGPQFLCVTPGIRLPEDDKQDQKRIMTPQEAITAGSDYLVIGRPITQSSSPQSVLQKINESIM
jgi:orotidine-5'-phosphate decarboxylase